MTHPKIGTIAVVLAADERAEHWIETFSDEHEIEALEGAIRLGKPFPLDEVYELREKSVGDEEDFGDYVEVLLSKKAIRTEIQRHGVAWMKSKIKIDHFKTQEKEAAEVIAGYALDRYKEDRNLTDFMLAGPGVQVRVRIFVVRLPPGTQIEAA